MYPFPNKNYKSDDYLKFDLIFKGCSESSSILVQHNKEYR